MFIKLEAGTRKGQSKNTYRSTNCNQYEDFTARQRLERDPSRYTDTKKTRNANRQDIQIQNARNANRQERGHGGD